MSDTAILLSAMSVVSLTSAVGISAGFAGVVMAIYLQLISANRCSPTYVALFYLLGSGLVLVNFGVLGVQLYGAVTYLPVIGNLLILGGEVYLFRWVLERTDPPTPAELLDLDEVEA